ncbi:DUF2726 domain-containing protein [Campylobacter upsaliensis]|nr:DUF2726 domain-containing protein [Campylobacter upsaliensis]CAG9470713.1 DUF2726 domain-containing protein [Campylobacter upsaliensis]HED8569289.1 DUF2726 domain-containing protein [Campylobacter upsaliensis]
MARPSGKVPYIIAEKEEKKEGSYSEVFNLYNQLYVDFLLISKKDACPFAVLEFNDEGHYGKNDKIKEKPFKMANLYYIELNFSEIQDSNNSKLIDIHQLDKYLERLENEFLFFFKCFLYLLFLFYRYEL